MRASLGRSEDPDHPEPAACGTVELRHLEVGGRKRRGSPGAGMPEPRGRALEPVEYRRGRRGVTGRDTNNHTKTES